MPSMKRVYKNKKASVHWSAARNTERLSSRGKTAYQPQVNRSFRSSVVFPGHALHEKGLQRQKGVVPLVGSQEQRALLVPLINR